MSGPATAAYSFTQASAVQISLAPLGAIVLAAMALREAHQMGREYQDVLEEVQNRADQIYLVRRESQLARIEERKVLKNRALQVGSQLKRLRALLAGVESSTEVRFEHGLSSELEEPADKSADGWNRYITALQIETSRVQAFIRQHNVSLEIAGAELSEQEVLPIEEALHAYMMHRALNAKLAPAQSDQIRQMVARILSRLDLEPGEPVPLDLDHLAQAIVLAPDLARAETLSMELRLGVQKQCEARALQRTGMEEARAFLSSMADDAPQALQQMLEDVAAGERAMDSQIRELARSALQAIEQQRKQLEEEAAAQVLGQSLRDLGYEVEGVENTFFIEGGVAHFQRDGWGEYFVRMRVDVHDKTLNFNVVRAKGAEESAERRRVDAMAEDRWCSEFPRMLETLAARGIKLDVKRLLGAGELPVQVVDASTLPAVASAEERAATDKLRQMQ